MPNQYFIKNFVGAVSAPYSASITSPGQIELTTERGKKYTLKVITVQGIHKISMHYKLDGEADCNLMFEDTPSQVLKFRERPAGSQPYFTLLSDKLNFGYAVAFPHDQFETFMQWKKAYVDNVPELKYVMYELYPPIDRY